MSGMATSQPAGFDREALRRAALSVRHPLTRALLVLTFTSGVVDAVSYLGLGRVFAANMTGNVVLLGFGLAGGAGFNVVGTLVSLVGFFVGAGAGGVLVKRAGQHHHRQVAGAVAAEVFMLGLAALLAALLTIRPNAWSGDTIVAMLAFAMGLRSANVRQLGVRDLTTTVLTMTLTSLASESRVIGGAGEGSIRKSAAVISMFAGALAGALLVKTSIVLPLVLAAGLAIFAWLLYAPTARRVR
jgi:uncharacterized membrane protein YoaK (UPF0700 family)